MHMNFCAFLLAHSTLAFSNCLAMPELLFRIGLCYVDERGAQYLFFKDTSNYINDSISGFIHVANIYQTNRIPESPLNRNILYL